MPAGQDVGDVYLDVRADTKSLSKEIRRAAKAAGTAFGKDFNKSFQTEVNSGIRKVGKNLQTKLAAEGKRTGTSFARSMNQQIQKSVRSAKINLTGAVDFDIDVDGIDAELDKASGGLKSFNTEARNTSLILSRFRGSRNNFLHFIGNISKSLEGAIGTLGKAYNGFRLLGKGMQEGVAASRTLGEFLPEIGGALRGLLGSVTKLSGGFSGLGAAIGKGVLGLAGTFVQFMVIGKIITTVAAGISLLSGAITVLGAAITNSLLGALVAVGPMLGSLAVGAGAAVAGIQGMSNETRKALGPIKEFWKEMSRGVSGKLFDGITQGVNDFIDVLKSLRPILEQSATSINQWAKGFLDALSGGEMQQNLKVFQNTWPKILSNLGQAFTNTFTGLSGVLAAVSPAVVKISDGIAKAAEEFSDWANSASGKNTIADWFNLAWSTADKLLGVLGNVASGIMEVFSGEAGKQAKNFLGWLQDITKEFKDWAESPEGQKEMKSFFQDVSELASVLKEDIGNIKKEWDKWNTKENRQDFITLVDKAGDLVVAVMKVVNFFSRAFDWAVKLKNTIADMFGGNKSPEETFSFGFDYGDSGLGKLASKFSGDKGWGELKSVIQEKWNQITTGLTLTFSNVKFGVSEFGNRVKEHISKSFENVDFGTLGQDLINGIRDGLVEGDWVGLGAILTNLIAALKSLFGIGSPATTMIPIGLDLARGIIKGLVDNIATGVGAVLGAFNTLFTQVIPQVLANIGKGLQGLGGVFSSAFQAAANKVGPIVSGIGTKVGQTFDKMRTKVTTVTSNIASFLGERWQGIRETVGGAASGIAKRVGDGFNNARNAVRKATTGIRENVSKGWSKARSTVNREVGRIQDKVSSGFTDQQKNVGNRMDQIRNKIRNSWDTSGNNTQSGVKRIQDRVQSGFQNARQSVDNAMDQIVQRIRAGMQSSAEAVANGMSRIRDRIQSGMATSRDAVSNGMSQMASAVSRGMNQMASAVSSGTGQIVSQVRNMVDNMVAATQGVEGRMYSAGVSIMRALAAGVRSQAGIAAAAVASEMAAARAQIPTSPAKEGPFSGRGWVTYSGKAIIDGLVEGIQSRSGNFARSLQQELGRGQRVLGSGLLSSGSLSSANVRAISLAGGAGTTTNHNRSLNVASGAIVVNAPQADPRLVAAKTLDRLVRSNV